MYKLPRVDIDHTAAERNLNGASEFTIRVKEIKVTGTSLAAQWLRRRLPMQGVRVRSLVGELRSHMPHGQKTKT